MNYPIAQNNDTLLVSVIMPVYNSEEFLSAAVNSILNQSYRNLELICVNDGSTDDSLKILRNFEKKDNRVKVINFKKNKGLTYALNAALKVCKGDFIARMDSDDISHTDRIKKQVDFLLNNPDILVVGTQCNLIDEKDIIFGKKLFPTGSKELYKMMFEIMPMQHPTIMVRSEVYKKVAYENQSTAEDVSLFFRLLQHGSMANLDEVLFDYRIRRDSNSFKNVKKTFYITFKTRLRAVREWGYKPSIHSVLLNVAQFCLVSLVPSSVVMAIYESMRFSRPLSSTLYDDVYIPLRKYLKLS
jgi:glycosyltransferase involved in cell wall biosynthesis